VKFALDPPSTEATVDAAAEADAVPKTAAEAAEEILVVECVRQNIEDIVEGAHLGTFRCQPSTLSGLALRIGTYCFER
jgi:hypothetical protein